MSAKVRGIGNHHRPHEGASNDWLTPPELIQALGPFDLDPCASVGQPWKTADVMLTKHGLMEEWNGFIWLNPPYGPSVGDWLSRLADHGNGIALIFARTEMKWFHEHVWPWAQGVFFFAGRLHFHRPVTGERMAANAGAPSVLIAYGPTAVKRLQALDGGKYVQLTTECHSCSR